MLIFRIWRRNIPFFDVPLDSRVKPRKLTPRIGGISKGTSSGR
jgi:hypothetical protein